MKKPDLGDVLPSAHPNTDTLSLLRLRRSTTAGCLGEPGPDADTLADLLEIAARVPDHRRVTPFRFIVFQNDARRKFGDVLEKVFRMNEPDAGDEKAAFEGDRFLRAPVVIGVVSSVNKAHRTPEWEQILSCGAVCQNLLIATSAYGFGAQWLTEWYSFDEAVGDALQLGDDERIAGFVYIGTAKEEPKERGRPDMAQIVSYY
ncbi:nitroreductase [Hyphococcus flavus]|uniref:Putative NAD(P)H nitroreductase n=1 Tax=Hyphococcus flavus TaxID=1866326 RepID=A0AAF0CFD0_9PROT|nr:nitroreductase [Hyphococcus flavus]WDI31289.1 nitroreductase [Hyphococcus flavus]